MPKALPWQSLASQISPIFQSLRLSPFVLSSPSLIQIPPLSNTSPIYNTSLPSPSPLQARLLLTLRFRYPLHVSRLGWYRHHRQQQQRRCGCGDHHQPLSRQCSPCEGRPTRHGWRGGELRGGSGGAGEDAADACERSRVRQDVRRERVHRLQQDKHRRMPSPGPAGASR